MTMEENHQRILEIASKYQVSAVNQVNEIGKALTFWCEILFKFTMNVTFLSNYLLILVD